MALIMTNRRARQVRHRVNNLTAGGDTVILESVNDHGLENFIHQRIEIGQGDDSSSTHASNTGIFFQIMRQIALDFSLVEYYVRSKVVRSEEVRLQERLLEEVIKAAMAMLLSVLVWLILFLLAPRIFVIPLAPIYTIACISQCFIGRLIWNTNYGVDDTVRRRMQPVQDRLNAERAHLTRMVEHMVLGNDREF